MVHCRTGPLSQIVRAANDDGNEYAPSALVELRCGRIRLGKPVGLTTGFGRGANCRRHSRGVQKCRGRTGHADRQDPRRAQRAGDDPRHPRVIGLPYSASRGSRLSYSSHGRTRLRQRSRTDPVDDFVFAFQEPVVTISSSLVLGARPPGRPALRPSAPLDRYGARR